MKPWKAMVGRTSVQSLLLIFGFILTADVSATQLLNSWYIDMNRPAGSCQAYSKALGYTKSNAVCSLYGVKGALEGGGEYGRTSLDTSNRWVFKGSSCQPGVGFWVMCY